MAFANVIQRGRIIAGGAEELIVAPWAVVIMWVNSEALKKAKHQPRGPSRHCQINISPMMKRKPQVKIFTWQGMAGSFSSKGCNGSGKIVSVTYFIVISIS